MYIMFCIYNFIENLLLQIKHFNCTRDFLLLPQCSSTEIGAQIVLSEQQILLEWQYSIF